MLYAKFYFCKHRRPYSNFLCVGKCRREYEIESHVKCFKAVTTTTPAPTPKHRVFRFGPFLPVLQPLALPHPTLPPHPPHLLNPFDTYTNINPIPELPPRPEEKLNGYYDLDGNFVSYANGQVSFVEDFFKKGIR